MFCSRDKLQHETSSWTVFKLLNFLEVVNNKSIAPYRACICKLAWIQGHKNNKERKKRKNNRHFIENKYVNRNLISVCGWVGGNSLSQYPVFEIRHIHLRHHSHDTAIVFDTNPSERPLTISNSVSSLIQLCFGMLYHLILSLLLLWINLNHRSKPTTSKQFSIL